MGKSFFDRFSLFRNFHVRDPPASWMTMKNCNFGGGSISLTRSITLCLNWLVLALVCLSKSTAADIGERNLEQIRLIVNEVQTWKDESRHSSVRTQRPFITLSFAQSLDGKIAAYDSDASLSKNLPISGEESLYMTHALRSIHDAILVGGKTLLIDNPRLTNRLWGENCNQQQPRPVILDTHLKYIQKLGNKRKVQNAILCCAQEALANFKDHDKTDLTILGCKLDDDGHLDLQDVLFQLGSSFGIQSLMVEGGSNILSSFASKGLVDCLCITIAPKLIGHGLPAFFDHSRIDMSDKGISYFIPLGDDCILLGKWPVDNV